MKKIYSIIFTIILFLMFNLTVKADDLKCMYDIQAPAGSSASTEERTGGFKLVNGKIKYQSTKGGIAAPWGERAPEILDEWLNSKEPNVAKMLQDNGCPKNVYICITGKNGIATWDKAFVLLKSELLVSEDEDVKKILSDLEISRSNCYPGVYNEERSNAPTFDLKYNCDRYSNLTCILKKNKGLDTSDCDDAALQNNKLTYNEAKDKLISFCRLQLENGNSFDECVSSCLNLSEDISEIEGTEYNNNSCSFSQNLIGFINNILKWVKYLIPAIIIILSILDFIKAIGADKDEEMKKAQQKFMKRLVIAVLIFIIPFILEFVLDKMGFVAEGCGIIEF